MMTLNGRTAVMTGASGYVGRGAVRQLVSAGMNVVMVTHNMEEAQKLTDELKDCPGKCVAMSNENGDGAVFGDVYERFGSVDVIIPNHGAPFINKPLDEISESELDEKLHHQITISFNMVQQAIPYLKKSKAARIILMGSVGARNGFQEEGLLDCVARGGVISMTYYLANALAPYGITVNCIAKGGIENDHPVKNALELDNEKIIEKILLGRNGSPEEFGAAIGYLASEEAGFITGQILNLNGGMYFG